MNPIQDYSVIAHTDQAAHSALVNMAIKEGWQPHGGISITVYINSQQQETIFFAQAVVRWADDNAETTEPVTESGTAGQSDAQEE